MSRALAVAKLESRPDAGCVAHHVGDVVLLVDTLEQVGLRPDGEDADVVATVTFRSERHGGGLLERIGS